MNCNPSSCSDFNITDVTSANEEITVVGKPADFQDTSVYSLSFNPPQMMYYVPTRLFSIFPNVQSVNIYNVSLNHLVSDAFTNAGNVVSMSIYDNNFPDLPASFCSSCINITSLNMMNNYIVNVDNEAFKGLKFLTTLMLQSNKISCIPPGLFRNTPVIQHIDLSYNQITSLDRLTFKGLPNLYYIMLGSNRIASIPDFDFTLTGTYMGLNMMFDSNPVMAIHPQFLTHLFTSRTGYSSSINININDNYGNTTTCLPKNNMYTTSISSWSWPVANISIDTCYANWTPELEFTPVSCAPPIDLTTTTTEKSGGNESDEDFHHWGLKKNFFAIISNAMRNFTANVQFT